MARDFESFIVDPSLLDPSIDATDLRTTTDTRQELLSDVPDYAGIQFDPTRTSYLDDLYALYSGQLPMTPTATTPVVGLPANGGGGGGVGVETPATITPSTPITTDLTDDQINEFAMPNNTGGITSDPITVENIGPGKEYTQPDGTVINIDPLEEQMLLEELYNEEFGTDTFTPTLQPETMGGAVDVFDINQTGDPSQNPGSINVGDQPMAAGPFDYLQQQTPISQVQVPGVTQADLTQAQIDEERIPGYTPSTSTAPQTEIESALSQAFRTGKEALDSGMQTISQVGQSIADSVKGTYDDLEGKVDVPGLGEISVRDTLAGLAINAAVGAPVSLVKYAMDQLPKSTSQLAYEGYTAEQQAAVNEVFGPNGSMVGYNAVSAFGTTPAETIQNRIDNIKDRKAPQTDASKKQIEKLEKDLEKITGETGNLGDGEDQNEGDERDTFGGVPGVPDAIGGIISPGYNYVDTPGGGGDPDPSGPYDGYDDFDDGTMTGAPASTTDEDPIGGFFDAVDKAASDASSEAMGGDNSGFGGDTGVGQDAGTSGGTGGRRGGAGGNGGDGCFIKGTLITMADGSTKPVEQVDLKDNVAEGGKVFATGKFLIENLYDYKGIKVSGSHMVHEDSNWVRVEDSKQGKPLGNDEHTVYVFGSENRRILINDILFTDYFEVNEQNILMKDSEDFFNNSKNYGKIIDKQNVDILNAS